MIHFNHEEHGARIAATSNSLYSPVTMTVISRSEGGVLMGGSIFENFTGNGGSIAMHAAGFEPNWVCRDLLFVTFDWPFKQLECTRIFGQVPANNDKALKFNTNLGFKPLVRLEAVFPDGDMILMQMLREDCRFLNIKPRIVRSNREQ